MTVPTQTAIQLPRTGLGEAFGRGFGGGLQTGVQNALQQFSARKSRTDAIDANREKFQSALSRNILSELNFADIKDSTREQRFELVDKITKDFEETGNPNAVQDGIRQFSEEQFREQPKAKQELSLARFMLGQLGGIPGLGSVDAREGQPQQIQQTAPSQGLLSAFGTGFNRKSTIGSLLGKQLTAEELATEAKANAPFSEELAGQAGSLIADAPIMALGASIGGPIGALALPSLLSSVADEVWGAVRSKDKFTLAKGGAAASRVLNRTLKSAITGGVLSKVPGLTSAIKRIPGAKKLIDTVLGEKITQFATTSTALAVTPPLLEGRAPTKKDFATAVALSFGFELAHIPATIKRNIEAKGLRSGMPPEAFADKVSERAAAENVDMSKVEEGKGREVQKFNRVINDILAEAKAEQGTEPATKETARVTGKQPDRLSPEPSKFRFTKVGEEATPQATKEALPEETKPLTQAERTRQSSTLRNAKKFNVEVNKDNTITGYHGTRDAKGIRERGELKNTDSFFTSKEAAMSAAREATGDGKPEVIKVDFNTSDIGLTGLGRRGASIRNRSSAVPLERITAPETVEPVTGAKNAKTVAATERAALPSIPQVEKEVALFKEQVKNFPKLAKEIKADADKRAARASSVKRAETIESENIKRKLAAKEIEPLRQMTQEMSGRIRATQDKLLTATGAEKTQLESLLEFNKGELEKTEDLFNRALVIAETGQSRQTTQALKEAALKRLDTLKDESLSSEPIELLKRDYNPLRTKEATRLKKNKQVPGRETVDFHQKIFKIYDDLYKDRLAQIDTELKEANKKGNFDEIGTLKKEKEALEKMTTRLDTEHFLHDRNLRLREVEARKRVSERLKAAELIKENKVSALVSDFMKKPTQAKAEVIADNLGVDLPVLQKNVESLLEEVSSGDLSKEQITQKIEKILTSTEEFKESPKEQKAKKDKKESKKTEEQTEQATTEGEERNEIKPVNKSRRVKVLGLAYGLMRQIARIFGFSLPSVVGRRLIGAGSASSIAIVGSISSMVWQAFKFARTQDRLQKFRNAKGNLRQIDLIRKNLRRKGLSDNAINKLKKRAGL